MAEIKVKLLGGRVSNRIYDAVVKVSQNDGLSQSEFVRQCVLKELGKRGYLNADPNDKPRRPGRRSRAAQ